MKNNKILVSALALSMGLGAIAPVAPAFAAETNVETANAQKEGRSLVESLKTLTSGKQDVSLTKEEERLATIFGSLSDKDKAEVVEVIESKLSSEGYSLAKNSKGEYVVVSREEGFDLRTEAQEYAEGLEEAKGKKVRYIELEDGKYTYFILPEKPLELDYNLDAYKGLIDLNKVVDEAKANQSDVELFETEEEAEEAAKKALEENDAFAGYDVRKDEETEKFYFVLTGESLEEDEEEEQEEQLEENNENGYETRKSAEEAAKKALEENDAFNSYNVYENEEGRWFFTLKSDSDVVDTEEDDDEKEGYATRKEAEEAAKEALKNNKSFKDYKVYQDEATGRWFFTLTSSLQIGDGKGDVDGDDTDKTDNTDKDDTGNSGKTVDGSKGSTTTTGNTTTGNTATQTVAPAAVNKENLNKAIVDAEILIKDGKGTQEQRDRLQRAVDNARLVRDKANVTQSELDREEKAVRDIMNEILGINKENANSTVASDSKVKTGVAGIAGVAGVLAAATAGYALNKKRK